MNKMQCRVVKAELEIAHLQAVIIKQNEQLERLYAIAETGNNRLAEAARHIKKMRAEMDVMEETFNEYRAAHCNDEIVLSGPQPTTSAADAEVK